MFLISVWKLWLCDIINPNNLAWRPPLKPLASSTALGLSVFLQCTSSVIWWFNLFPIKVFQEKILMCFIEKMINLALFAGVTKSDFAVIKKFLAVFYLNHLRLLIKFPKETSFEFSVRKLTQFYFQVSRPSNFAKSQTWKFHKKTWSFEWGTFSVPTNSKVTLYKTFFTLNSINNRGK